MKRLTEAERKDVYGRLLKGAVYRSSLVALFFSASFVAYGFTSLATLQKFDPSITLWGNVWPRILLNGIPFVLLSLFFRKFRSQTVVKIWLWTLGFPIIMFAACTIHVWPLMLRGYVDLYLHVHAANALILVMAMIMVGPPPLFLVISSIANLVLFAVPVSMILIHLHEWFYLKFFITDMIFAYTLGALGSHMNYTLRRKLATEDVIHQRKVRKFLGNIVSESIFENNEFLVRARKKEAFLISIDIRNFTKYTKSALEAESSNFKEQYHLLVSRVVGQFGGFIHKTHGDGHLISLGLMDLEPNLSDIPKIQSELEAAEKSRREQQLAHAVAFFEKLVLHFENLKKDLQISQNICLCAAIDHGEIGLKMLGDPNVRLEFDIEGLVVIRCARLEAYTKTLRASLNSENSFLIVSAAAAVYSTAPLKLKLFATLKNPVNDFADENFVYYKEFRTTPLRKKGAA
jgi:class 3 adenylate cyclase